MENTKLINWLKENYFLAGIFLVVVFALIWNQPGIFIKKQGLLTPLTFAAMFLSGLGLPFQKIKGSFKDYKSIIYSFGSVFVIFPVIAYLLMSVLNIVEGDLFVGAMILAVQSSTLASAIVLTMSAGGNVPLALIITIINNISSAFLSPVLLGIFLSIDKTIVVDVQGMIVKLVLVLILPVVLAQILRIYIKDLKGLDSYRKVLSKIIVLSFILTGISTAAPQLAANLNKLFLIITVVVVLHLIMLTLAFLYSRLVKLDTRSRTAVLFCSSQKTLPASLMIWGTYFSGFLLAPILIVSYHVSQLIIDSIIVNRINKKAETESEALTTN